MNQHITNYYNSCHIVFCKNSIRNAVVCVSSERLFVGSLHYIQPEATLRREHKIIWIWHEWVWSSFAGTHLEVAYERGQASLYLHQCKPKTWNDNNFWVKYMNRESERNINLHLYMQKKRLKIFR